MTPAAEAAPQPATSAKPPEPSHALEPPMGIPVAPPAAAPPPMQAPPAEAGSAEKTVPPPLRPRPLSVVAGSAAPASAAERSWAPAPRPLREAPPPARLDRSPVAPVAKPRAEGADLGSRLLAGVLDMLAVGLMQAVLLAYPAFYWWSRELVQVGAGPVALSAGLVLLTAALGALYFIYYWGIRGATPGKRLLGLDVEGSDGSFPIGVSRASARFLGYLLSGALLGGGFLLILLDGSGLHDRLAGTRVVRRRR